MLPRSTRFLVTYNTAAQFIGRIISSGSSFLVTILLARSLNTNGYGDFTKITTYISFFYLFADFGMNAAFLRLNEQDKRITFSHLFGSRIILSLILTFLSLGVLLFFPQGSAQGYTPLVRFGILLFSISIISQAIITTTNALFQQRLRYDLAMIAVVVGSLLKVLFVYLLAHTVIGSIGGFLIGSLATMGVSLFFVKRQELSLSPRFSLIHSTQIFKESLPLGITLVFNLIYFRVDSILLTLLQSTADVGNYNLAYSFFEFALVLPIFFMNALYPIFLKRKEQSLEAFFRLTIKAAAVLLILSLFMAVSLWITAQYIPLIKPEFSPAIAALQVLSFSVPFFFLTSLTMWMMITLNKRTILLGIYGLSMIGNILANLFFLPKFGFIAAAWITFFGEGFVLLISTLFLVKEGRQTFSLRRILTP